MSSMHSAIKMLIARITLVHQLLLKMQSGEAAAREGGPWPGWGWSTCCDGLLQQRSPPALPPPALLALPLMPLVR